MAESVSVSVTVQRLSYASADGSAVFAGVTEAGERVRVVASKRALPRTPVVGEVWQVDGTLRVHQKYGEQLQASHGAFTPPKGRLLISYLAGNPDFAGIGPAKAKALYDAFGDHLPATLSSGDLNALETVLTRAMAIQLVDVWAEKQAEAEVVLFLDEHGFDVRLANKLRRVWGSQTMAMLKLNPYYMLAFAGWGVTDSAAAKLGLAKDDERRLVGAVESALYARLQDAHTLTPAAKLRELTFSCLGLDAADHAIELAVAECAVVGTPESGYQPIGAAALEARIAERLRSMMAGERPTQFGLFKADFGPEWLDGAIAENEATQGFSLNVGQRDAVLTAVTKQLSVLTGGAGVGKTTVLKVVIDIAHQLHLTVLQMALAGRAAKRMAEATGVPAMTIAKFLHQAKDGKLEVPAHSLVIVDEASMLDLPTTFRILRYLPDGVRLLLVGDPAQLPPIGFGLVFHRLVESASVPKVELTEVHRQAAATGIPGIAADIRAHVVPRLAPYAGQRVGVSFIACPSHCVLDALRGLAEDWAGDDWQILGAVKDGASGIRAINADFHDRCAGARLEGSPFSVGEPVIHLVNDYERGLMNGTLGASLRSAMTRSLGWSSTSKAPSRLSHRRRPTTAWNWPTQSRCTRPRAASSNGSPWSSPRAESWTMHWCTPR